MSTQDFDFGKLNTAQQASIITTTTDSNWKTRVLKEVESCGLLHQHPLKKYSPGDITPSWGCDAIHAYGKCFDQKYLSVPQPDIQGWGCLPCDYGACKGCLQVAMAIEEKISMAKSGYQQRYLGIGGCQALESVLKEKVGFQQVKAVAQEGARHALERLALQVRGSPAHKQLIVLSIGSDMASVFVSPKESYLSIHSLGNLKRQYLNINQYVNSMVAHNGVRVILIDENKKSLPTEKDIQNILRQSRMPNSPLIIEQLSSSQSITTLQGSNISPMRELSALLGSPLSLKLRWSEILGALNYRYPADRCFLGYKIQSPPQLLLVKGDPKVIGQLTDQAVKEAAQKTMAKAIAETNPHIKIQYSPHADIVAQLVQLMKGEGQYTLAQKITFPLSAINELRELLLKCRGEGRKEATVKFIFATLDQKRSFEEAHGFSVSRQPGDPSQLEVLYYVKFNTEEGASPISVTEVDFIGAKFSFS